MPGQDDLGWFWTLTGPPLVWNNFTRYGICQRGTRKRDPHQTLSYYQHIYVLSARTDDRADNRDQIGDDDDALASLECIRSRRKDRAQDGLDKRVHIGDPSLGLWVVQERAERRQLMDDLCEFSSNDTGTSETSLMGKPTINNGP